jgi:hypothetical protein
MKSKQKEGKLVKKKLNKAPKNENTATNKSRAPTTGETPTT